MKIEDLIELLQNFNNNDEVKLKYNTDGCAVRIGDIYIDNNTVIIEGLNYGT